jgi:hypothetical protein
MKSLTVMMHISWFVVDQVTQAPRAAVSRVAAAAIHAALDAASTVLA